SRSICAIPPRQLSNSVFARYGRVMCGRRYNDEMRKSNVALRLQVSLLDEARRVTEAEGVALNQFINVAVSEKLSALRTEVYFRERAGRGDAGRAKRILKRAGRGNPPVPGDELDLIPIAPATRSRRMGTAGAEARSHRPAANFSLFDRRFPPTPTESVEK